MSAVERISGRGCVLPGHDIDTDRIIPARFLMSPTFEGLQEFAFHDDRAATRAAGAVHALDDPRFLGAGVLIVGRNFGCGSSREHAPQALVRRGFHAYVGESFGDIFAGNCLMLGKPCVTLVPADLERLAAAVSANPSLELTVDVAAERVVAGALTLPCAMPPAARAQLLDGSWDSATLLASAREELAATAARLPYMSGF